MYKSSWVSSSECHTQTVTLPDYSSHFIIFRSLPSTFHPTVPANGKILFYSSFFSIDSRLTDTTLKKLLFTPTHPHLCLSHSVYRSHSTKPHVHLMPCATICFNLVLQSLPMYFNERGHIWIHILIDDVSLLQMV